MAEERKYQIGEVAEAVGLSLHTIRHYGEVGVVPPSARSPGGFRLYTEGDIRRFELVKLMKPLDFTLEEMRLLLEAVDAAPTGDAAAQERLAMFAELVEERCVMLQERLRDAQTFTSFLRGALSGVAPSERA